MPIKKPAGRLLNKNCYRVHNQKAKYFLRKDCSACFLRHSSIIKNRITKRKYDQQK